MTIEFLMWFPTFFMVFLWMIDASILFGKMTMFERAVDLAARDVRLGVLVLDGDAATNERRLRERICRDAVIVADCNTVIALDMEPLAVGQASFDMPSSFNCVSYNSSGVPGRPALDFTAGAENEVVLVRACALVRLLIPRTGIYGLPLVQDSEGRVHIPASSTFVIEPTS